MRLLLARGFQLAQAVQAWQSKAMWVVSRADAAYPRRLKVRLKEDAPAILYGCGDPSLLNEGGLAVVGSRKVDDALLEYTARVGRLAARADVPIVSGGARGVDQAAMKGVVDAKGRCVGVLSDSLEKAALRRDNREALANGRLVLVSSYDPKAGFNVGHAMGRNKYIYALADAALVVNTDLDKGGTWAGAVEQLEKLRFVSVFVRDDDPDNKGLRALKAKGALRWPEPEDVASLQAIFHQEPENTHRAPPPTKMQGQLFAHDSKPPEPVGASKPVQAAPTSDSTESPENAKLLAVEAPKPKARQAGSGRKATPAEVLFRTVRKVLPPLLEAPCSEEELAPLLGVTPGQALVWLEKLGDEGLVAPAETPGSWARVVRS